MKKRERAIAIQNILQELYPNPLIPLDHKDPFTLLVAVILSAQCTDKKVNEITPGLYKIAPDSKSMANLTKETIYNKIKQIGLAKSKTNYLYETSKILTSKYNGQVPNTFSELESLPGVGHKTASVVMAQAFGIDTFPVDTHIHRLAQRWRLTKGVNVLETEKDLKNIFPQEKWNILHIQIIYYGREYCTSRGCNGTVCRICKEIFPKRKNPIEVKKA